MNSYLDVQLKADAEIRENELLNKVYTKLHKALCDLESNAIGVSFPNYHLKLGNTIRLHGSQQDLTKLQTMDWLGGLSGYCDTTDILSVPQKAQYRTVSRVQTNLSMAKLRRLQKRGSLSSPEEVKQYKRKLFKSGIDNPYIELISTSNGKTYRRYFQFGELQSIPAKGQFDSFGLSKTATIPWF